MNDIVKNMNNVIKPILILLLLLAAVGSAQTNLLSNDGFESGSAGQLTSTEVPDWDTNGGYAGWHIDAVGRVKDTKAITFWYDDTTLYQEVSVTPHEVYNFSVDARDWSGETLNGWDGLLRAKFYDDEDSLIVNVELDRFEYDVEASDVWVTLSGAYRAPADSAYVRVSIGIEAAPTGVGGSLDFDDAKVVQVSKRLCGYETSDAAVTITTVDTSASVTKVLGGVSGAPYPTEGDYVLEVDCGHEVDETVTISHAWSDTIFALESFDRILVDVWVPSAMNPLMYYGMYDDVFGSPTVLSFVDYDSWATIEFDVSSMSDSNLDHIYSLWFSTWASDDEIIYIDNLRLLSLTPELKTVTGQQNAIEVYWEPMDSLTVGYIDGYNVYRAPAGTENYTKIANEHDTFVYVDFVGDDANSFTYKVTSVRATVESSYSLPMTAAAVDQTDAQFLETMQRATFRYFWDHANPFSGFARNLHPWQAFEYIGDTTGTAYGIKAIIAGVEHGWVTRAEAARETLKRLRFYDSSDTFHGAFPHYVDGASGEVIPFMPEDDGGDIVLTSLMTEAFICAREYYDGGDAVETEIRSLADSMWRDVDWNWYRRMPETDGDSLYFHWSPTYGWWSDFELVGYFEALVTYVAAIASPTNPIPVSCWEDGWQSNPASYINCTEAYGTRLWASTYGSLFVFQMPFTCLDPDYRDNVCNYFDNGIQWTKFHRNYAIANPYNKTDYGANEWGMSADIDPWGYQAHYPFGDNGTLSTTAILASMPFTPTESIAALRHMYDKYGEDIYGAFGFVDSYNRDEDWFTNTFNGVNMGTNFAMVENYRSDGLYWDLFMADPNIQKAMDDIGFTDDPDAGLRVEYFEGEWTSLPDFDSIGYIHKDITSIPRSEIKNNAWEGNYGLRFTGLISIDTAGTYTFYSNSKDGSKVYVGGLLVVDNDGLHGSPNEESGTKYLGVETISPEVMMPATCLK